MTHIIQTLAAGSCRRAGGSGGGGEGGGAASEAARARARMEELQTALKRVAELEDRVRVLDGKTRRGGVGGRARGRGGGGGGVGGVGGGGLERESVLGPLQAAVDGAAPPPGAAAIASLQVVGAVVEMVTVARPMRRRCRSPSARAAWRCSRAVAALQEETRRSRTRRRADREDD